MVVQKYLILIIFLLQASCSGIDVKPLNTWDTITKGFRYYMPEPYLLVTKISKSSIRIDFTKGKQITVPSDGTPEGLELGKVEGLGKDKAGITVEISDIQFVSFNAPDANKPKEKKIEARGFLASVPIKFVKKVPDGQTATFTLTARVGNVVLGSGKYQIKSNGGSNEITALGGSEMFEGFDMKVIYLPNPKRILAVEPTEGIGGNNELNFKLKDGWMLTEMGAKSDTQSDENITAAAGFIGAIVKSGV